MLRSDIILLQIEFVSFAPAMDCWEDADDSLLFWQFQATFVPSLGRSAICLFSTLSNSIPSENLFLAQNLIHDKKHNTLDPAYVNKLFFIYTNQRCLDTNKNGRNVAFFI
jgi:hypothetical protein